MQCTHSYTRLLKSFYIYVSAFIQSVCFRCTMRSLCVDLLFGFPEGESQLRMVTITQQRPKEPQQQVCYNAINISVTAINTHTHRYKHTHTNKYMI